MTKLTKFGKHELKEMKKAFDKLGGTVTFFPEHGVTVAAVEVFPGSTAAYVSVSVAAATEEKWRRKVGEYHALRRMEKREIMTIPFFVCLDSMERLAATVADLR